MSETTSSGSDFVYNAQGVVPDSASIEADHITIHITNSEPAQQPKAKVQKPGKAGFWCGLIGLLLCWLPFAGFILGIMGFIFSLQDMRKYPSYKLPIAGLIISIVGFIISLPWFSLLF